MKRDLNNKLIIRNYTDMSDIDVLLHINAVIHQGKVSEVAGIKQYCFVTTFKDGIDVYCNRKGTTHTFYVLNNINRKGE